MILYKTNGWMKSIVLFSTIPEKPAGWCPFCFTDVGGEHDDPRWLF